MPALQPAALVTLHDPLAAQQEPLSHGLGVQVAPMVPKVPEHEAGVVMVQVVPTQQVPFEVPMVAPPGVGTAMLKADGVPGRQRPTWTEPSEGATVVVNRKLNMVPQRITFAE